MTDEQIDDIYWRLLFARADNNKNFMDWWKHSMQCPRCQPAAMKWQGKIRQNDVIISEINKPSCA